MHLRPRIAATINKLGTGTVQVAGRQVELKRSVRQSVAWKPLAYSQLDEAVIDDVKVSFTEETEVNSARVVQP